VIGSIWLFRGLSPGLLRPGRLRGDAQTRRVLPRAGVGGGGQQRRRPPAGAAAPGRRRARGGPPGEAVRAGLLLDTGHNRKTDPHDAAERRETARGGDAFHSVPLPRRRTPTTCVGSR